LQPEVDADWRPGSDLLSCDSLEDALAQLPDSNGMEAFDHVRGIALVKVGIADPINRCPEGEVHCHGFLDNGGTWPVLGGRWLFGLHGRPPRYIAFRRDPRPLARNPYSLPADISDDDQLLVPISTAAFADTLVVRARARPMVVRHGKSIAFGVPVEELRDLFARDSQGFRLKPLRP
jgi:hypothetical protein